MSFLIADFSGFPKDTIKVPSYLSHAGAQMVAGRDLEDTENSLMVVSVVF